jgi:hypothetical protein
VTPEARPVYRTQKHRAQDLVEGDVIRNRYGKWDVVTEVHHDEDDLRYTGITTECGNGIWLRRSVDLVDVQVVKPS